jgi:hypothetical protein
MKIWKIYTRKDKNTYLTMEEEEFEKLNPLDYYNETIADEWDSSLETYIDKERTNTDVLNDAILFSTGLLTLNDRTLKIFTDLAGDEIEYLKFKILDIDENYTMIHVTDIVDCVDFENSICKIYRGNYTLVQSYKKIALKPGSLEGKTLFRINNFHFIEIWCTDDFKNALENAGVTGLGFEFIAEYQADKDSTNNS